MKESLQTKLARSLDSAKKRQAEVHPATPPPAILPALPAAPVNGAAVAPASASVTAAKRGGNSAKISVSLFPADLARVDAICRFMADRGHRMSTSHAIKLALRTAPLSDALASALEAIRKEDGRVPKRPAAAA